MPGNQDWITELWKTTALLLGALIPKLLDFDRRRLLKQDIELLNLYPADDEAAALIRASIQQRIKKKYGGGPSRFDLVFGLLLVCIAGVMIFRWYADGAWWQFVLAVVFAVLGVGAVFNAYDDDYRSDRN